MDRRLYLDLNSLAARTAWAHGVLAFFARPYALAIFALLLLLALAQARLAGFGGADVDQLAGLAWVPIGTALAYAVALPIVHLVARVRPFRAMPKAIVLVTRPSGFSFPNEHAVIAGAVAAGIWLSRSWLLAALATLVAVIVTFSVVYAGIAYPGDALGGLLLGAVVSLGLYPLAIGSLRDAVHGMARSPVRFLVGGGHHGSIGAGPAARPQLVGETGAVRILSPEEVGGTRARAVPQAGPVRILTPEEIVTGSIEPLEETGGVRIIPPGQAGPAPSAETSRG
jgi:undecaprenyl-diphosphatase